jgi:hypothetical protein
MQVSLLTNVQLMFIVARRELTSILRGKAERLLFLWTSLFLLPLITLGALTVFLIMRTTDVLHPVRLAVPMKQMQHPETRGMLDALRAFPEVEIVPSNDPRAAMEEGRADAAMKTDGVGAFEFVTRTDSAKEVLRRSADAARRRMMLKFATADHKSFSSFWSSRVEFDQYKFQMDGFRYGIITLYMLGLGYSLIWLIPAIDVVRFDFLQNNIFANLSLPVPMFVVIGGKLISGIVITLLPTLLSGIAFVFSMMVAVVVVLDYVVGGLSGSSMSFADFHLPMLQVPWLEIFILPIVVLLAVAFLYSWLMVIVMFFQGQRLSFLTSSLTLLILTQFAYVFGMLSPTKEIWPNAIPFFGVAAVIHQIVERDFSVWGFLLTCASTIAATVYLNVLAARFYTLEEFSRWFRWLRRPTGVRDAKY